MLDPQQRGGELVLAPCEFAHVQDTTKGLVTVLVGPNKTSMSNTDSPVIWDEKTNRFKLVVLEQAKQSFAFAPEGCYMVLSNPATNAEHPREGGAIAATPTLLFGRKVNLPGPANFPLWPGQSAQIIPGHVLRSNQYLIVRIVNEEEAKKNWGSAVMKLQTQSSKEEEVKPESPEQSGLASLDVSTLAPGQLLIIRGNEVSFYIPPTGVEVVPDAESNAFVREALTLERLEYCILLDEDGNKRYLRGPDVVFPEPTESFVVEPGTSKTKFKAIELNQISGIYVKVIADYKDEVNGKELKLGEELFITGGGADGQQIYYPRPEHAIIKYGQKQIHYATAVPEGEGRYLLNRLTGDVDTIVGPRMLLPDPRFEVLVKRILTTATVELWFPGNAEAKAYNATLEAQRISQGATEYLEETPSSQYLSRTEQRIGSALKGFMPDEMTRSESFSKPRTITLDNKFEGAVSIDVYVGYAVLATNKTGKRRVIVGPQTVLLDYDEKLMVMELSTGKPKTTDHLQKEVYLRVSNNKVSDIIVVTTSDMVDVELKLSYRVNFIGEEPEKWFAVENYVKFMCDHIRSLLKATAMRTGVEELYSNSATIVRDLILGKKPDGSTENAARPGMLFKENNCQVYDVEVLATKIQNPDVAHLLYDAQQKTLKQALDIASQQRDLTYTKTSEEIKRKKAVEISTTEVTTTELKLDQIKRSLSLTLEQIVSEAKAEAQKLTDEQEQDKVRMELNEAHLAREKSEENQRQIIEQADNNEKLRILNGEVEAIVKKASAISPDLIVALQAFSNRELTIRATEAMGPLSLLGGKNVVEILTSVFGNTSLGQAISEIKDGFATRRQEVLEPNGRH